MEVEGADRRRVLARDHRHQHLELQLLRLLRLGEELAAAAEERIGRHVGLRRQAERAQQRQPALQPHVAPLDHLRGRAGRHELAHAERLHPRGFGRRLVAVHPVGHRDQAAAFRQRAAERWIDRIAGRGVHHHAGLAQQFAPVAAFLRPLGHGQRLDRVAEEAVDGAAQMGKRIEVVHLLEDAAVDHRRIGQRLRLVVARDVAHQRVEALQHVLEHGAAAEHPLHAGRHDEAVANQAVVEALDVVDSFIRHGWSAVQSSFRTMSMEALLAAIRSLEIIRAPDNASR